MLLAREPQMVAPAVDAFYNRDLAAMKASKKRIRICIYTVPVQLPMPRCICLRRQSAAHGALGCAWHYGQALYPLAIISTATLLTENPAH